MTAPLNDQPEENVIPAENEVHQTEKRRSGMWGLLTEFGKFAPNRVSFAVILGMLSGALYSLAIPLILSSLREPGNGLHYVESNVTKVWGLAVSDVKLAVFFLLFCGLILVTRALSSIMLAAVSLELTSSLRMRLCDRIARAPYPVIESLGQSRLTVVVTDDVRRLIDGAETLPLLLINGVMLIGIFGFLCYLNSDVFIFVLEAVAIGIVTFQLPIALAGRYFSRARDYYDETEKGLRGLILGIKELKLDRKKRTKYFHEVLNSNEQKLVNAEKKAITTLIAANSYGDMLFFFAIGSVTFIFVNYHALTAEELIAVVMVLLYITSPIAIILNSLPRIAMAAVSLERVERIFGELPSGIVKEHTPSKHDWQDLSFNNVCYRHKGDSHHDGFSVGPINFEIRKGEITFLVGGNGSGKSTVCKMLSLHYPPAEGEIRFGEHTVAETSIEDFRQDIAIVFSDYYLFDRLLCEANEAQLALADHFLEKFDLKHKVNIKDGLFSTTDLSDGQRKRLALVGALIDNKAMYILDEWAADQDPIFKKVFYTEILLMLKMQGKAVVIVSHDDRYFHLADQLLIMEDGKLVEQMPTTKNTNAEPLEVRTEEKISLSV